MRLVAHFALAFAAAPPLLKGLTSPHTVTRGLIMQKANGHPGPPCGGPKTTIVCKHTISGTISLPYQGFFSPFPHGTSSLSVISRYLALEGGPSGFKRGFTCPALLGIPLDLLQISPTGLSPSVDDYSKSFGYPSQYHIKVPQPPGASTGVWAVPLSLATTYGITVVVFSSGY